MFKKNSKGLSLLEAFISSIIFVIATAAIFVTLNGLRKPAVNNEQALSAALTLKNVLEDLRGQVSQADMNPSGVYTSGNLTDGQHGPISTGGYTIYYNVTTDGTTKARRIDANVSWTDAM